MHSFLHYLQFQIGFKILHNLRDVFRTLSNIYDEAILQL